jgi:hypothetical protein
MKKIILFILFFVAFISINAQTILFDQISSGISLNKYHTYCMYRYNYVEDNMYKTTLYDVDTFVIGAIVNKRHFVSGIFMCGYPQTSMDIHSKLKKWVSKFSSDLKKVYGQPVYSRVWDKNFLVNTDELVTIYKFKNGNVELTLDISENNGFYYVYMEILDLKFYDGEKN